MCKFLITYQEMFSYQYLFQILNIKWYKKFPPYIIKVGISGLILGLRPANERCHYKVTASLIDWAQT